MHIIVDEKEERRCLLYLIQIFDTDIDWEINTYILH